MVHKKIPPLYTILIYLIVNRVFLLFVVYLFTNNGVYYANPIEFIKLFSIRWDGNSYHFLSQNGYTTHGDEAAFIVFPPVYPLLITAGSYLLNSILAGFIISNICFILAMIMWYKLLILDYSHKFAQKNIILISLFPTSFFFSVIYPESLFFLLTTITLFCMRSNQPIIAVAAAWLATLTRPFGVLLWGVLAFEWIWEKEHKHSVPTAFAIIIGSLTSIMLYLGINYYYFRDIFAFQHFLENIWSKSFSWPWNGIWQSLKRGIYTPEIDTYKYLTGYSEAFAAIASWTTAPIALLTKMNIRPSYLVYLILASFMFTSTNFLLSGPRYLLSIPPFFIVLGFLVQRRFIFLPTLIISFGCFLYLSILYLHGQWVY